MNHTPGPWETNTEDSERGHSIFAANDELVATAWFVWDNDNEGRQANNAKLIAAAPDLLEALEAIRIRAFEAKKQGLAIGMSDIFAITNNAINKATQ